MNRDQKAYQNKLRRKYHYSTNTNYGRGICLIKTVPHHEKAERAVVFEANRFIPRGADDITLWDGREIVCGFSFEEFELIYKALKAFQNERIVHEG